MFLHCCITTLSQDIGTGWDSPWMNKFKETLYSCIQTENEKVKNSKRVVASDALFFIAQLVVWSHFEAVLVLSIIETASDINYWKLIDDETTELV